MKRDIRTYPDPCLGCACEEIQDIDDEVRQLAEDMVETMYEAKGVGLAAPQVGANVRMIVVDVTAGEEPGHLITLINPRVVDGEGSQDSEEGCLSVPGQYYKVKRKEKVRVEGLDLSGNPVCIETEDFLAIVLQHEIDHLDGTIILDHVSRLKRALYDKKVKKLAKRQEGDE